jgi:hypothetical protein
LFDIFVVVSVSGTITLEQGFYLATMKFGRGYGSAVVALVAASIASTTAFNLQGTSTSIFVLTSMGWDVNEVSARQETDSIHTQRGEDLSMKGLALSKDKKCVERQQNVVITAASRCQEEECKAVLSCCIVKTRSCDAAPEISSSFHFIC